MPNRQTKTPGIIARRITRAFFVCLPLLHNLPQYQPRYTQQNRASRFLSSFRFVDVKIALCYSQGHQPHKRETNTTSPSPSKGLQKRSRCCCTKTQKLCGYKRINRQKKPVLLHWLFCFWQTELPRSEEPFRYSTHLDIPILSFLSCYHPPLCQVVPWSPLLCVDFASLTCYPLMRSTRSHQQTKPPLPQ